MGEIQSPFLQGQDNNTNNGNFEHPHTSVDNDRKKKGMSAENSYPQKINNDEDKVLEIGKDGQTLKKVIIFLIILLLLAILGIALLTWLKGPTSYTQTPSEYNLDDTTTYNPQVEDDSFEMESHNFKASSVVIE